MMKIRTMFFRDNSFLSRLSCVVHLYGIPKVSKWVGSRLLSRILAWWVTPMIAFCALCMTLLRSSVALVAVAERFAQDVTTSGLAWVPLVVAWALGLVLVAVLLLSPAVMILLYVDPVCFDEDSFDDDSLLNVFDPDRFLKVPYWLSAH